MSHLSFRNAFQCSYFTIHLCGTFFARTHHCITALNYCYFIEGWTLHTAYLYGSQHNHILVYLSLFWLRLSSFHSAQLKFNAAARFSLLYWLVPLYNTWGIFRQISQYSGKWMFCSFKGYYLFDLFMRNLLIFKYGYYAVWRKIYNRF